MDSHKGVWAFYYIQGEDGEDRFHPNAFCIPTTATTVGHELTLADVQKHLPLHDPHAFHYRFRLNAKSGAGGSGSSTFFWLDLISPEQKVPISNGRIICKLLRLERPVKRGVIFKRKPVVRVPPESGQHRRHGSSNGEERSKLPPQVVSRQTSANANVASNPRASPRPSKYSDAPVSSRSPSGRKEDRSNDSGQAGSGSTMKRGSTSNESFEDFLSGGQATATSEPASNEVNFMGESSWSGNDSVGSGRSASTFMSSMDPLSSAEKPANHAVKPPQSTPQPANFEDDCGQTVGPVTMAEMQKYSKTTSDGSNVYNSKFVDKSTKSEQVRRAMEEREQQMHMEVQKARDELRQREEAARSLTAQKEAAAATLGPKLKMWAEDNGRVKNIRTLLSTMHTVMWEGSRWSEVNMGKLLQTNDVKKHYRKAMIVVHPDKSGGRNAEQLLIAERVFAALNTAWDEFMKANPC